MQFVMQKMQLEIYCPGYVKIAICRFRLLMTHERNYTIFFGAKMKISNKNIGR